MSRTSPAVASWWGVVLLSAAAWSALSTACERPKATPPVIENAAPSPAASIFPSPLVTLAPTATDAATTTSPRASAALATNAALRHRETLAAGSATPRAASSVPQTPVPIPQPPRLDDAPAAEGGSGKEGYGVVLAAEWRWPDAGGPPARPEVNGEGIATLRKQLAQRLRVTVSEAGRLRLQLESRSFPVPAGSELRSRADLLGHIFVFPSGTEHRWAPLGSLRALFSDRRLDVAPLLPGEIKARTTLPARFGGAVERIELTSRSGSVSLELLRAPEAGVGAVLLCRTLVELAAIDPRTEVCAREELPIRAQLGFPGGGGAIFEVIDLKRRADLPVAETLVPPGGSTVKDAPLPAAPSGLLVSREEAQTFRTRAIDLPPSPPANPGRAPVEGLFLRNATDTVRYVTVDGLPVAFLAPNTEQAVTGLPRGRYNVQWRSFLGDAVEPAVLLEIPARSALGEPPEPVVIPAPAKSAK